MCRLTGEYKESETFTGYKVVYINKEGKMLSPVSGIEYREGMTLPVIKPEESSRKKIYEGSGWCNFFDILNDKRMYEPKMEGRTGVFTSLYNAKFIKSDKETIVKMTIEGDLMEGLFECWYPIIAGRKIKKIEQL